jgi:CubicO group peptidase (beta-lactamase class C family)
MKRICILLLWAALMAVSSGAAELAARFEPHLEALTQEGFSGIVLVAKGGEIVFERGYGLAHRERGTKISPETVFTIGSITKQFTGAAILKLEMAGHLRVEDPISRFFDDVPADKRGLTLHHLLTHSAGFPGAIGHDFTETLREEFVRLAMETPLASKPGERYEYSNVGYSLLAAVVELVTKGSYEVYLRDKLFLPAGMKDTGYVLPEWQEDRLAHGYRGDVHWGTVVGHPFAADGPYWHLRGNGGIHSTARDMFRWHLALVGDEILSPSAKEKLYTRHISEGGGSYYGYGWSLSDTSRGTRLVTHNGGNPYFFADFLRFIDEDVVVFLASGSGGDGHGRVGSELARMVFDPSYQPSVPGQGEAMTASGEGTSLTERYGLPGSPTGRRSAELLAAIASVDQAERRQLVAAMFAPKLIEKRSVDGLVEIVEQLAGDLGDFELVGAQKTGPVSAELTLKSGIAPERMTLSVELEVDEPHRIVGVQVEMGD